MTTEENSLLNIVEHIVAIDILMGEYLNNLPEGQDQKWIAEAQRNADLLTYHLRQSEFFARRLLYPTSKVKK